MEPPRRGERKGRAMREIDSGLNELARRVIGAAIEVQRRLGPGFLESTHQRALMIELEQDDIRHECEKPVGLQYRGQTIGEGRLDLLVEDRLIVELKAVDQIHPIHKAQVISYLKATCLELALLIKFNVEVLREGISRLVLTSASFAPFR